MSPYVWLIIAAVMAVVEIVSLSLITIWFVAGGIAAFLAGFFGADLAVQIVVFLVVSVVVEAISGEPGAGRVETADHMTWAALSADSSPIEKGARVRVVDQKSVRLIVERIE